MNKRKIYTSYFANPALRGGDQTVLRSIANTAPKGWKGKALNKLRPGTLAWDYKDGKITEETYEKNYLKRLASLDKHWFNWRLLGGLTLLCWEKDGFCHRHILAKFLQDKGFTVEEL